VVADRDDTVLFEHIDGFFDAGDSGGINDDVAFPVVADGAHQQLELDILAFALAYDITQVGTVKARDVLVRIAQLELLQNVVTDAAGGAGGEGSDGAVGKICA
jgi:hypothetical protein